MFRETMNLLQVSDKLRDMNMMNMVRRYCKTITADQKWQFEQKVVAEALFKDKKLSYTQSVRDYFVDSRLGEYPPETCKNRCAIENMDWNLCYNVVFEYL